MARAESMKAEQRAKRERLLKECERLSEVTPGGLLDHDLDEGGATGSGRKRKLLSRGMPVGNA